MAEHDTRDSLREFAAFEGANTMIHQLEKRVGAVEAAIVIIETDRAVNEEKRKFMEARFNQIDRRLDKIDGHISRLVWLIIAAILGGFMSFVMQGNILNV